MRSGCKLLQRWARGLRALPPLAGPSVGVRGWRGAPPLRSRWRGDVELPPAGILRTPGLSDFNGMGDSRQGSSGGREPPQPRLNPLPDACSPGEGGAGEIAQNLSLPHPAAGGSCQIISPLPASVSYTHSLLPSFTQDFY